MGNKQFKVQLLLDRDGSSSCSQAGDVVTGRVVLSGDGRGPGGGGILSIGGIGDSIAGGGCALRDAILRGDLSGIRLVLEGTERSQILATNSETADDDETGAAGGSRRGDGRTSPAERASTIVDQSSRLLVRKVQNLADFGGGMSPSSLPPSSGDRFEFPFRFRIPERLPGSFRCGADDGGGGERRGSFAEIRYTMSAHLFTRDDTDASRSASATIKIRAAPTPVPDPTARNFDEASLAVAETEVFPVKSCFCCLCWELGEVSLGFRVRNKVVGAGLPLIVECYGRNNSEATVSHLVVKLIEIITWRIQNSAEDASNATSVITTTSTTTTRETTSTANRRSSNNRRKKTKTIQNVLARAKVSLESCPPWRPVDQQSRDGTQAPSTSLNQPLLHPDPEGQVGESRRRQQRQQGTGGGGGLPDEGSLVTAVLEVPEHSVDTYKSELIDVRHSVVVTAQASSPYGCLHSATPEVSCSDVRVVRQESDANGGSPPVGGPGRGRGRGRGGGRGRGRGRGRGMGRRGLADAPARASVVVVPADWTPAHADAAAVNVIPEATAVLVEDGAANVNQHLHPTAPPADPPVDADGFPPAGMDHRRVDGGIMPVPSAPTEEPGDDVVAPGAGAGEGRASDLETLRSLVRDQPQNLAAVLGDGNDGSWSGLVRDLSPAELWSVLLSSTSASAPSAAEAGRIRLETARTLARCMGSGLTCRHVLACLYGCAQQDTEMRTIVLTTVAPMASDLDRYQSLIEQELRADEIVRFHAALYEHSRSKDGMNG